MTVSIMKKTKNLKTRMGIFKSKSGNIPGGNFLVGDFPGWKFSTGEFDGREFSGWEFS